MILAERGSLFSESRPPGILWKPFKVFQEVRGQKRTETVSADLLKTQWGGGDVGDKNPPNILATKAVSETLNR